MVDLSIAMLVKSLIFPCSTPIWDDPWNGGIFWDHEWRQLVTSNCVVEVHFMEVQIILCEPNREPES